MAKTVHTLVVTLDDEDSVDYEVECPGISDDCRAWRVCTPCSSRAATDDQFNDELYDEEEMHGVEHQRLMGEWMVPTEACLVVTHDYLWDSASYVTREPGRYPVVATFEDDGEFLVLDRVAES
jgi:hypothetical protein